MEPGRARAALRRAIYYLRQRLGPGVLPGKGEDAIRVDPSRLWCDAAALTRRAASGRLVEVVDLYRGLFLPGIRLNGARGFERWLDRQRRELRDAAADAAVSLATRARVSERTKDEIERLRQALDISPEREPILRDLLRAMVRAGDRGRALETYRRWSERRERDPGLPPSSATRELAALVRSEAPLPTPATESETGGPDALPPSPAAEGRDGPAVVSPRRNVARELAARARELAERGPSRNLAARELAGEAIRLDGESAAAYAARAEARAQAVQLHGADRGILRAAVEDVRASLTLGPHLPEAHFSHGLVLETAGKLRAATGPFRRAAELSEDEPEFAGHHARVLMMRGRFDRSLDWIQRRAERGRRTPHILLQLGLDHWCLGLDEEAAELYQEVREKRSELVWLGASWSFFELTRGRIDEARTRAEEMLDEHPEGFAGRFAAGDAALFARDYDEALEHYEQCYRLDPDSRHPGIHRSSRLALGFVHLQAGDPESGAALVQAAEREAERLLGGGADYAGLWVDLAAARAALGRTEPALEALERAAKEGWRQPGFLERDPIFDTLRLDDRFKDVIAFIGDDIREQRKTLE
jgi:tetratricopeptide (TPR) repeat protein